jgi:hypothetical protein
MIDYINDAKAAASLPHSKGFASNKKYAALGWTPALPAPSD